MSMVVVVAALLERDGRVLISQRREPAQVALKWEFPGGKMEKGESPERALERELREELGVETRTGRIYDVLKCASGGREILLLFYKSRLVSGEPRPLESNAVAWAAPSELGQYDFLPADLSLIERIAREGL